MKLETKKLGSLLSTLTDYHANGSYKLLKKNVELLDESGYALMIRTTNFEQDNFERNKYINEYAYNFLKKSKVYPNDILMNKIANAGSVYLMPDLKQPVSLGMNLFLIRINHELANPKYVYYYLKSNEKYIKLYSTGAATSTITKEKVRKLEIKIPNIETQDAIVFIISSYNDLIETNRFRIQLLEETARLLFREWFVYFRFPGYEKAEFEDHDGIQIPAGWEYLPITKVKIFKKTKVGVPVFIDTRQYYQTSEIDGTNLVGSGEEVDYENRPSRADIAPRLNSVYFAKMKDTDKVVYFNKGNAELLEKILLSTGMAGFSTDEKYLAFLFGLLTSYEFVQNKNNYATGATQVSLSDGGLKKIKVIFPKLELIEKYSSIINPFLEECSYLRSQNQKLAQARDLLLPRLMSGKIEV